MASGTNAILGAVIVIFALVIGMSYGIHALGAVDSSQNMTGSPYEEQYNATVEGSTASLSLVGYLPYLLAVFAIIAALVMMRRVL